MARRIRLDAELVRRGLARSREQAAELVAAGRVEVRGTVASKAAAMVDPADPVVVRGADPADEYVSRGGHKLAGALAAFGAGPAAVAVAGRRCLDAGASTGGFTDVLLRGGRRARWSRSTSATGSWPGRCALIRGYGCIERTNVRTLTPERSAAPVRPDRGRPVVHLAAAGAAGAGRLHRRRRRPGADGQAAVRGRQGAGRPGGVVRDPALRAEAVLDVAPPRPRLGLGVAGVAASPLPGPSGNVEFFVWLRRAPDAVDAAGIRTVVERAYARLRPELGGRAAFPPAPPPTPKDVHDPRQRCWSRTPVASDSTEHARTVAARPDRGRLHGAGGRRGGRRPRICPACVPVAGPNAAEGVEIVFALGGDGTLLRAAELARPAKAPLLGINLGKVGFLAEAEIARPRRGGAGRRGPRVHGGRAAHPRRDRRASTASVIAESWALNEVSVEKGDRERMLELLVDVDGRPLSRYGCDGVVCATPTGSTAYAFSAGGPVVWPEVEALLLVPISAHALFSRPLVTAPTSTIAITVDPYTTLAVLCCDGRRVLRPAAGRAGHRAAGRAAGAGGPAAAAAVHRPAGGEVRAAGGRLAQPAIDDVTV